MDWLCDEVEHDLAVVRQFVRDYRELLDTRLTRVRNHVRDDEEQEAVVALLSLETSSTMIGEVALAGAAQHLRTSIGQDGGVDLEPLLSVLVIEARHVKARLDSSGC